MNARIDRQYHLRRAEFWLEVLCRRSNEPVSSTNEENESVSYALAYYDAHLKHAFAEGPR